MIWMRTILLITVVLFLASCKQNSSSEQMDILRNSLMEADKNWSAMSAEKGYNFSRTRFAATDAINMLQGSMPLRGIKAIEEYASTHSDTGFTIHWKPIKADVALSGELGYTFGSWILETKTFHGKDTLMYGDYITVWRKLADGSWKYVIDGGNDTPGSVE